MPKTKDQPTEGDTDSGLPRLSIRLIAIIAVIFVLYYARGLFLPFAVGSLLALVLSPVVRAGERWRVPSSVTATLLVFTVALLVTAAISVLASPVSEWLDNAPRIGLEFKQKMSPIRSSLDAVARAGEEVEKIAEPTKPGVQEVQVKQPGVISRAADDVLYIAASFVITLALTLFLLLWRDLLYVKVIRNLPTLQDRKLALRIATDIESQVSVYLLNIALINLGLGVAIGILAWALDMPNPLLWGLLGMLLNYLPYIGAFIGIALFGIVAVVTFDDMAYALLAPLGYLALTVIEGQFFTPVILGRRFELNTVAVLIAIAFWGFVWGLVGVIIAVPILIVIRVVCEHVSGFSTIGDLISGEQQAAPVTAEAEASASGGRGRLARRALSAKRQ